MSRILVIDDEPIIRNLMVEILELGGHDVVDADTAEARSRCSRSTTTSISSSATS